MSVKAERGTKRTCQSSSCGARFYDLNRDPVACPICGTAFDLTAVPVAMAAASTSRPDTRKTVKKPVFVEEKQEDAPEAEGEEALVALEDVEATDAGAEADETFLEEEEEDGSDMSNIIGGPVAEGEEQT